MKNFNLSSSPFYLSKLFEDAVKQKWTRVHLAGDFNNIPFDITKFKKIKLLCIGAQVTGSDAELNNDPIHILGDRRSTFVSDPEKFIIHDVKLKTNNLPEIFHELEELVELQLIGRVSVKILPEEIYDTSSLTSLILFRMGLSEVSEKIGKLLNLRNLIIAEQKIKYLPDQIYSLQNLIALSLSSNEIDKLSREIGNLTQLIHLDIGKNNLTQLPRELGNLAKLRLLRLSDNHLLEIPTELRNLKSLKILNLRNNSLHSLPNNFSSLKELNELDLQQNPLPIPPEILKRVNEPQSILNYYFSVIQQQRRSINEIKLISIGQGSVGKTSLVQRILHDTFDQNQIKTEGISINQWTVASEPLIIEDQSPSTVNGPSSIKLNIWDFGGQEIMHATHQFFLTKRSLYLLVLDARLTQEENRVEYWLKIIQSFGGESPVLIVGNKTDQHPLDIDRTGLQKKYPNIVGIIETSAATGAGIEELKTAITEQVNNLPHVRDLLPEAWFTVKTKLEELGKQSNFITHDKYLDLCTENEVSDETSQRTLIGFLHDLGVVLHFQDDPRLEALGILNPQWVTNGVYKILNSHELFQNQGTLTLPILNKTLNLPEYPSNKRMFIVDMMKKFELCYDIEPDKSFLIPDLLPKDEPFTGEWDGTLAFQYHYNVLPTSIISRFIVRMNAFVHKTVWRSGVVLKNGSNTALVKADTEEKKIYVWVSGDEPTRRDFLSAIRMEFDAIHKTIARIEATEIVPHPQHPNLALDYDELIAFERQGVNEFPRKVGAEVVICNVRELLNGIRPPKNQAVKVFISYGHDDKGFVQKLAAGLGKENIETWWDFDHLKGGDHWQKEIQKGIKLCDFFIVVLSPHSVDREWVIKEITYANEYKKKVIPLMLKECERPISIIEKQYIDFEKQAQKAAIKELIEILRT